MLPFLAGRPVTKTHQTQVTHLKTAGNRNQAVPAHTSKHRTTRCGQNHFISITQQTEGKNTPQKTQHLSFHTHSDHIEQTHRPSHKSYTNCSTCCSLSTTHKSALGRPCPTQNPAHRRAHRSGQITHFFLSFFFLSFHHPNQSHKIPTALPTQHIHTAACAAACASLTGQAGPSVPRKQTKQTKQTQR